MSIDGQPTAIAGLAEVVDRYDAFLVDQFGVLHDGTRAYPHAVDTLERLRHAGARVILLSNSGKRSSSNAMRLERLGFSPDMWTQILTSGEVGWSILANESAQGGARRKCLLIARDGDCSAIEGLPIDPTSDSATCDFVLIAGSEGDTTTLDAYRILLAPAAARGVPAYCTNPDTQMLTPGGLRFGAGRIATLYEELGGNVVWIGKPYPAIYAAALQVIDDVPPARILCIGDSIDHDIAGARAAGLDSCLITGGILEGIASADLPALFAEAGATPTFVAPDLRW
jgi:HAD superfamily hydrolase (TIGR01459 family)